MGASNSTSANGDNDERVALQILEIPDAEVVILNSTASEIGVTERGRLQLMLLRDKDKRDRPGKYRITAPALLSSEMRHDRKQVLETLEVGTIVNIQEIVTVKADNRVRARVENPAGWISLEKTTRTTVNGPLERWAEKQDLAMIYVGTEEFSMSSTSEDEGKFYYPLVPETPLRLVYETRIISVSANEGDCFTIRLPKDLPEAKLWELVNVLPNYCDFRLEKKKDAADHVTTAATTIAKGVDKAAEGLASLMQRSGATAKNKMEKREDVNIGFATKFAVGAVATTTRGASAVTNAALDTLMGKVMDVGKDAGRQAGMNDQGPPGAGKAALIGGLQIFDSLRRAAELVTTVAADEMSGVVEHRYGKDVGGVARGAMEAGMNAAQVAAAAKGDKAMKKAAGRLAMKSATYKLATKAIRPLAEGFAEGARASAAARPGGQM